jgi:hypothetical protein
MRRLVRPWRRVVLAYRLRCAREDARIRGIIAPVGIWVCHHCPQVSFSQYAHTSHVAGLHA